MAEPNIYLNEIEDIDLNDSAKITLQPCKQYDDISLNFNIFYDGVTVDLSLYTIDLRVLKPDNTFVIQDQDKGMTINANNIKIECERDITRASGKAKCELRFVNNLSKQKTSFDFIIPIKPSVISDGVLSGNIVTATEELNTSIAIGNTVDGVLKEDIAIGQPLQATLHQDIIDANEFKDQLNIDIADGKVLQPILQQTVDDATEINTTLNTSNANAQASINLIRSAGNPHFDILTTDWVANTDTSVSAIYMKDIIHTLETESIQVTSENIDTKMSIFNNYKTVDVNTKRFFTDTLINLRVILSARYYDGGSDIGDEVKLARGSESNLGSRLDGVDEQLTDMMYNVKSYGAKCDGVTDDTQAIKDTIIATPIDGTLFIPEKCLVTDTILVDKQINFICKHDIIYGGTRDKTALHFSRLIRKTIDIQNVKDINTAYHGWTSESYVGVTFENLIYCKVKTKTISNFTVGVRCKASGGLSVGCFFNDIDIYQLYNNKIQLEFYYDGVQSWINSNIFRNTIFTYDQSGLEFQTAVVDRYCIKDTHVNSNEYPGDANIFYDLRFDTSTEFGGTYTSIKLERAINWRFENYRAELVSGTNVKLCVLDNIYNAVKGIYFKPILELFTSTTNINVSVVNNTTNLTTPINKIYTKEGLGTKTLSKIYSDGKFNKRYKTYIDSYNIVEGLYSLPITSTTLAEGVLTYGARAEISGGIIFSNAVLHLKNLSIGDCFKFNLSTLNTTNLILGIKAWDINGNIIDIGTTYAISMLNGYWSSTNKALMQSVASNTLEFCINSANVATVSIIFGGQFSACELLSSNVNTTVLNSISDMKNNSQYHYVSGTPTLTNGFAPGDILMNNNTATGQVKGWQLQNVSNVLTWVSFGMW